jgi:hypothetical protein
MRVRSPQNRQTERTSEPEPEPETWLQQECDGRVRMGAWGPGFAMFGPSHWVMLSIFAGVIPMLAWAG